MTLTCLADPPYDIRYSTISSTACSPPGRVIGTSRDHHNNILGVSNLVGRTVLYVRISIKLASASDNNLRGRRPAVDEEVRALSHIAKTGPSVSRDQSQLPVCPEQRRRDGHRKSVLLCVPFHRMAQRACLFLLSGNTFPVES
jgi:hypothetical protein